MSPAMPPPTLADGAVVWLIVVWLTVLGAVFGSFLNVVIYRLPRRMSLIEPPSHCPTCKKPIAWYDNVPVLGWIVLRGRCRKCRAPISVRYPVVEAATAAMFGVLGTVEFLSGGANLPQRTSEPLEGVYVTGDGDLYTVYVYHLLLLCTLLCAALIEFDGKRRQWRLFIPAGVVGLLAPLFWPHLHPVPAWRGLQGLSAGLADGAIGLAVGAALGMAAWWAWKDQKRIGVIFAAGCVGLFLGWQAVVVLSLASMAIYLPSMLLGRRLSVLRRVPPTAWLALATFGWILAWAPLVRSGNPL